MSTIDPIRVKQLEADLELSETLRRGLERDLSRLKEEHLRLQTENSTLSQAGADDQQALFHAEGQLAEWKGAVIDALVVSCILTAEHEIDPKKALNDLLAWESQVALDPAVSKDARAWVDAIHRSDLARMDAVAARDRCLDENARLVELRRIAESQADSLARMAERYQRELAKQIEITVAVVKERDRLLSGDFTAEEIHGFCHKLAETVSREEFERGCREYQTKLYGWRT